MVGTPRLSVSECAHSGEKKNEVTRSGVYVVCADCGKRLKKIEAKLVIEKVVMPELVEKIHGSSD